MYRPLDGGCFHRIMLVRNFHWTGLFENRVWNPHCIDLHCERGDIYRSASSFQPNEQYQKALIRLARECVRDERHLDVF
jgi:hypothetical protein